MGYEKAVCFEKALPYRGDTKYISIMVFGVYLN